MEGDRAESHPETSVGVAQIKRDGCRLATYRVPTPDLARIERRQSLEPQSPDRVSGVHDGNKGIERDDTRLPHRVEVAQTRVARHQPLRARRFTQGQDHVGLFAQKIRKALGGRGLTNSEARCRNRVVGFVEAVGQADPRLFLPRDRVVFR